MTVHNNRSFHSLDLTDSFGKEIKTITTEISDVIPALAADNCILFLLKLLLHKVLILLYQMVLIASLNKHIFLVANDNIFVVTFIHSHEHFVTINTPQKFWFISFLLRWSKYCYISKETWFQERKRFWLSFHFWRDQNRKFCSSSFLRNHTETFATQARAKSGYCSGQRGQNTFC